VFEAQNPFLNCYAWNDIFAEPNMALLKKFEPILIALWPHRYLWLQFLRLQSLRKKNLGIILGIM
jgi:hypothetical protein